MCLNKKVTPEVKTSSMCGQARILRWGPGAADIANYVMLVNWPKIRAKFPQIEPPCLRPCMNEFSFGRA